MTQAHPVVARQRANHPSQAIRAVVPQTITITTRKRIEDATERLMLLLDEIDQDQQDEETIHAKHRR